MFDSIINFKKTENQNEPVTNEIISVTKDTNITKEMLRDDWADPIVRNAIQLLVDLINMGFRITSDDSRVSEDIATINHNTDLLEFNDTLVRDAFIFGTAFIKYLFNADKTKIVGLWNMDAVKTDFYRTQSGAVKLSTDGTAYGYIETVPFGASINESLETDGSGNQGRFYKGSDNIVTHFVLEKFPGTIEGISRVKSAHNLVRNKWIVENSISQAIYNFGVPVWKYKVGNKDRPIVTPDKLKDVKKKMMETKQKSIIIMPWWEDLEIMYPKDISNITDSLKPYLDQLPAALGIPRALLFETGEKTNRGSLRQQIRLFITRINKYRNKLVSFYNKEVFPRIATQNGWKSLPKITFEPVTLEDIESMAERLKMYVDAGIFNPNEVKTTVKQIEDII